MGNQTIRDYNQNTFTNDLEGYNVDAAYNNVLTQNWWNNVGSPADGQGAQRLDVTTFVLPSSWAGSALVSMTISNSTPLSSRDTNDVVLSALQVDRAVNTSPFFNGEVALSNGVYYLAFSANGNVFGYYSFLTDLTTSTTSILATSTSSTRPMVMRACTCTTSKAGTSSTLRRASPFLLV